MQGLEVGEDAGRRSKRGSAHLEEEVRPRGPDKPPAQKFPQPAHLVLVLLRDMVNRSKKGIFPAHLPPPN